MLLVVVYFACFFNKLSYRSMPYLTSNQQHYSSITGFAKTNVALCFCSCLRQLLTDFQNFFTGTLCGQFAITCLLHISPHHKCVSTLPCEMSMKYALITIITNKHFGKVEKNTSDQHCNE